MNKSENIINELWSPLIAEQNNNRFKIGCFGREYYLNGMLPERIVSNGREVLASSAVLRATFNGVEKPLADENVRVFENSEDKLLYIYNASVGNTVLNTRVNVERDGLIWFDMLLMPFATMGVKMYTFDEVMPKLDGLTLEIPLDRNIAELYHYWPAINGDCVSNSGGIPKDGMFLPFRPHLWLGKEEAGLSFYAESDEGWQPSSLKHTLTVENNENSSVFKIHFLDHLPVEWQNYNDEAWTKDLEPLSFSFGLQASPVKPFIPQDDFKKIYTGDFLKSTSTLPEFEAEAEKLADLGVKWRMFHEGWSEIQNYGLPYDEEFSNQRFQVLRKHGIKSMVYFGYEYSSSAPGFFDDYKKNVIRNADGSLRGGWQRFPQQKAYMVCYKSDYSDVFLKRCLNAMENYGVDGIYTDGTYIPQSCSNAEHGCGYTDQNGARHEIWPLRSVREHVKKLYIQTHKFGGIVEAHQSGCVVPMILAYCDSYYDGELIALKTDPVTGFVSSISSEELIEKFTGKSDSGIDTVRAEFTGINFGIPCQFLSYCTDYNESCGLTLLYGVLQKPTGEFDNIKKASYHWEIMDKYGLQQQNFIPFWRDNCPVKCTNKDLFCSVWSVKGGYVAVLVKFVPQKIESGLNFKFPCEKIINLSSDTVLKDNTVSLTDSVPVYLFFETDV